MVPIVERKEGGTGGRREGMWKKEDKKLKTLKNTF